ncbi:MAG: hypothetical protein OXE76_04395, partial [Alphaproteobacteria bacterium]|nr:hypothetical protein [Alphaproteobacteria bacterium]
MNALFLKDLAVKTHRGLRGRVVAGKSGGGLCYGYDVVKSWLGRSRARRTNNQRNRGRHRAPGVPGVRRR